MLTAIVARARDGTIGDRGGLPWHLPADLKRFKALTMSHPIIIMGRATFDSLPGVLPGRRHIVLTRRKATGTPRGSTVAHDPDEALRIAGDGGFVIGGAQVFEALLPRCDRLELTAIDADFEGDTVMPAPGPEWREVAREEHAPEGDRPAFAFVTLDRT